GSRLPRSRMTISAPEGASPAAHVAPPMPDPTNRMSTDSTLVTTRSISASPYVLMRNRRSNTPRGLGVEQHRLVQVEYEGMVLTHADGRLGAHTRRQLLSSGTSHHVGVSPRRLDDFDLCIESGDRVRVSIDTLRVVDRFRPNAEDDLGSVGELCGVCAGGHRKDDR